MDDRLKMVRGARSAGQLIELARAEGVELTTEQAEALYAKYHPPVGELTDRELEDVTGGGCGQTTKAPKFQVGNHVMKNSVKACGYDKGSTCSSPYWVVERVHDTKFYDVYCPKCKAGFTIAEGLLYLVIS